MSNSKFKYRDNVTKRKRRLTSVQTEETIKKRIIGDKVSHVVYEGEEEEDLKAVRDRLKASPGCNLQIRNGKIYEIRQRPKRNDVIMRTMRQTIEILSDKELLSTESSVDDIYRSVKQKYKIKKNG
jgi:hypothetical protein